MAILSNHMDDEEPPEPRELQDGDVLLLAEDYGQGIARPSVDYFQSNLILHMYVMADVTRREHNVFIYDERHMSKDKVRCTLQSSTFLAYRAAESLPCSWPYTLKSVHFYSR